MSNGYNNEIIYGNYGKICDEDRELISQNEGFYVM